MRELGKKMLEKYEEQLFTMFYLRHPDKVLVKSRLVDLLTVSSEYENLRSTDKMKPWYTKFILS